MQTFARLAAGGDHFDIGSYRRNDSAQFGDLFSVRQIRFGQHHDRQGARVPHQHKESLELSSTKRAVETMNEKPNIDIRGQWLFDFSFSRIASH